MGDHSFPPFLKAKVEFVKWRAEDVFERKIDKFEEARDALGARGALGFISQC